MKNNSHYTLSISDLLMGFLFIFILILMKFIIDYHEKKEDYNKKINLSKDIKEKDNFPKPLKERDYLLERLKKDIETKGITVEINKENGTLELPELLCFDESEYKLNKKQEEGLKEVRNIFSRIICYSNLHSKEMEKRWKQFYKEPFEKRKYCRDDDKEDINKDSLIDTILIEGHADSTPILWIPGIMTNLDLAMKRSQNVFKFLLEYKEPTQQNPTAKGNYLYALVNKKEKSLFGMTSYGNLRSSTQEIDRKPGSLSEKERCINIRFIMSHPDEIQKDLKNPIKNKEAIK